MRSPLMEKTAPLKCPARDESPKSGRLDDSPCLVGTDLISRLKTFQYLGQKNQLLIRKTASALRGAEVVQR